MSLNTTSNDKDTIVERGKGGSEIFRNMATFRIDQSNLQLDNRYLLWGLAPLQAEAWSGVYEKTMSLIYRYYDYLFNYIRPSMVRIQGAHGTIKNIGVSPIIFVLLFYV